MLTISFCSIVRTTALELAIWAALIINFAHLKQHLPTFDSGISALVEDIYARGLDQDDSVVATVYHNLGIDSTGYIRDASERPVRILPEECRPIRELVGG